jgi:UDP-N-acetylglucosamine 2-epimerase (non-hydrolysing)/GDP/UDP-N,N'-diacetylbacillosamine 2-epimerase (hydrolysing)
VVTTSRADYGVYVPILKMIQGDPSLSLHLIVGGMHLSREFGSTVQLIEKDGFEIAARVDMLSQSDDPQGIAESMGKGVIEFSRAYAERRPDILIVLGDRFEMYSAALAALPHKIPVAHIHGGEVTKGAIDDALRHSMTKLAHLHFVSAEEYARRVIQLGEETWRVTVSGAPALDNLHTLHLPSAEQLEQEFGLELDCPPLLVTYHPVTLEFEQTGWQTGELMAALESSGMPVVFTAPNADTGGRMIAAEIDRHVQKHPEWRLVKNLGTPNYFGLMKVSAAMVGNSSSGIVEAAPFGLPVVNIGTRQQGRLRNSNIIDVGYHRDEILRGIRKAVSPEFRHDASQVTNLYGDGHAAERIVEVLKNVTLDDRLIVKEFVDQIQVSAGVTG